MQAYVPCFSKDPILAIIQGVRSRHAEHMDPFIMLAQPLIMALCLTCRLARQSMFQTTVLGQPDGHGMADASGAWGAQ